MNQNLGRNGGAERKRMRDVDSVQRKEREKKNRRKDFSNNPSQISLFVLRLINFVSLILYPLTNVSTPSRFFGFSLKIRWVPNRCRPAVIMGIRPPCLLRYINPQVDSPSGLLHPWFMRLKREGREEGTDSGQPTNDCLSVVRLYPFLSCS